MRATRLGWLLAEAPRWPLFLSVLPSRISLWIHHAVGDTERRIAALFNDYFFNFGIRISAEDVVVGNRETIRDDRSGWAITYRVDGDASSVSSLEFYATNRRTNDRHVLISADGHAEHLEALSEMLIMNSDNAVDDFKSSNEAIAKRLRDRGLYPHG